MKEKVNEKNVCDSAREVWTKKKKDKEEDVQRRRKIKKMKKKRESTCLQPSSSHDPQVQPPQSDGCNFDEDNIYED